MNAYLEILKLWFVLIQLNVLFSLNTSNTVLPHLWERNIVIARIKSFSDIREQSKSILLIICGSCHAFNKIHYCHQSWWILSQTTLTVTQHFTSTDHTIGAKITLTFYKPHLFFFFRPLLENCTPIIKRVHLCRLLSMMTWKWVSWNCVWVRCGEAFRRIVKRVFTALRRKMWARCGPAPETLQDSFTLFWLFFCFFSPPMNYSILSAKIFFSGFLWIGTIWIWVRHL